MSTKPTIPTLGRNNLTGGRPEQRRSGQALPNKKTTVGGTRSWIESRERPWIRKHESSSHSPLRRKKNQITLERPQRRQRKTDKKVAAAGMPDWKRTFTAPCELHPWNKAGSCNGGRRKSELGTTERIESTSRYVGERNIKKNGRKEEALPSMRDDTSQKKRED